METTPFLSPFPMQVALVRFLLVTAMEGGRQPLAALEGT